MLSCAVHASVLLLNTTNTTPTITLSGQPFQIHLTGKNTNVQNTPTYSSATTSTRTTDELIISTSASHDASISNKATALTQKQPPTTAVVIKSLQPHAQIQAQSQAKQQTDETETVSIETAITSNRSNVIVSQESPATPVNNQLQSLFATYFQYPALAQRRSWEGLVQLGVRIEADGLLSHIHILKSSGYSLLDHAALSSLKQIASLPEVKALLHGNQFDMVPVHYKLIDS